jgi:hypothetical protein
VHVERHLGDLNASHALMDTRPATAFVLIAYVSDFSGRHVTDMKRRRKLLRLLDIIGVVLGITFIIGFFVELLVFNRWTSSLAVIGASVTLSSVYRVFFEHRHLRHLYVTETSLCNRFNVWDHVHSRVLRKTACRRQMGSIASIGRLGLHDNVRL